MDKNINKEMPAWLNTFVNSIVKLKKTAADDEDFYAGLFRKVGETNLKIWTRFMKEFGDIFCVLRFGDDLGYKSNTMLS